MFSFNNPAALIDYSRFAKYAEIVANLMRLLRPLARHYVIASRPRLPSKNRLKLFERISLEVTIGHPRRGVNLVANRGLYRPKCVGGH
jgi:hypothetical protein